jgi:leucyl aminopeptidase
VPSPSSFSRRATARFVAPDECAAGDAVVLAATGPDAVLPHRVDLTGLDLEGSLRLLGFTGKPGTTARIVTADRSVTVVGVAADGPVDVLAACVAVAVRATRGARRVVVDVPTEDARALATVHRAAVLATYRFDLYRDAEEPEVDEVLVVGEAPDDLDRLDDVIDRICLARDLTSLPAADKTPAALADLLEQAAAEAGAEFRRYEEAELRELGLNGLLAVGEASAHRPVLVRLRARGTGAGTVAVVGKGVTYDAGGLNIKLAMLEAMKLDVGGAAAAAGAVLHAARYPRERGVTVWLGLCENVVSGTAYRGGDVLRMHNGLTVEVTNTDAEGRLTLADGMSLAAAEDPDLMLTVATLTGASITSLGLRTGGVMSTDDDLADEVLAAAARGGEDLWRLPMRPHFAESLRSEIADLNNVGDIKFGQTMVAAAFLQRFAPEGTPFVHLDIAGPAYNHGAPYAQVPAGGTGFGVLTLLELL